MPRITTPKVPEPIIVCAGFVVSTVRSDHLICAGVYSSVPEPSVSADGISARLFAKMWPHSAAGLRLDLHEVYEECD